MSREIKHFKNTRRRDKAKIASESRISLVPFSSNEIVDSIATAIMVLYINNQKEGIFIDEEQLFIKKYRQHKIISQDIISAMTEMKANDIEVEIRPGKPIHYKFLYRENTDLQLPDISDFRYFNPIIALS